MKVLGQIDQQGTWQRRQCLGLKSEWNAHYAVYIIEYVSGVLALNNREIQL